MKTVFYYLCISLFSLVVICGCGEDNEDLMSDDGIGKKGRTSGSGNLEGIKTIDLKEGYQSIALITEDGRISGNLSWCPPNNFVFYIITSRKTIGKPYEALRRASIARIGKINNLSDIRSIPRAGWTVSIQNDSYPDWQKEDTTLTSQVGYGYVIKYEDYKKVEEVGYREYKYTDIINLEPDYIRLHVMEQLYDRNNKIIGVRVKYQAPFIP